MKKISLKTEQIVNAHKVLNEAKYQKMSDDDKIKLWKISRKLSPIAVKASDEVSDAKKKFVPNDNFNTNIQKAQKYESDIKEGKEELPMTTEEYQKFVLEFQKYVSLVKKATGDIMQAETELEFEPISEDALGRLMASNDWTFSQMECLEFIIE